MTWTKGRVRGKEEISLHLTALLKLSVLEIGGSSVASQPTELRATGGFLGSFFWAGGDRGASLDLGKRTSWSLIIMVITLWIWGVPERRKRFVDLDHGKRWAVLTVSTHGMSLNLVLKPEGPKGPHYSSWDPSKLLEVGDCGEREGREGYGSGVKEGYFQPMQAMGQSLIRN